MLLDNNVMPLGLSIKDFWQHTPVVITVGGPEEPMEKRLRRGLLLAFAHMFFRGLSLDSVGHHITAFE